MGKILDAFLNDQLHVDGVKRTPEHQKLCEKGCELQDRLEERLNDEGKELLNRLIDTILAEGTCYAQSKFVRGYQLGVLMTVEVFEAQGTFICEGDTQ